MILSPRYDDNTCDTGFPPSSSRAPISEGNVGIPKMPFDGGSNQAPMEDLTGEACGAAEGCRGRYLGEQQPSSSRMLLRQGRRDMKSGKVLDAAALQDRLMRRMKLDLGGQQAGAVVIVNGRSGAREGARRQSRESKGARAARTGTIIATTATSALGRSPSSYRGRVTCHTTEGNTASVADTWTCQICSLTNYIHGCPQAAGIDGRGNGTTSSRRNAGDMGSFCSVCMHPRPTRSGAQCEGSCSEGVESYQGREACHPQQPRKISVTLAQIRGLEEPPEPTLTLGEWSAVEAKALARGDYDMSQCPICREDFQGESQVILSCSHVFHKTCLSSFERFLRARERSCPLCRKVAYQKRATRQGAVAWRQRCSRRIQTAFRAYRARRKYTITLRTYYSAGLGDPRRRREFLSGQAADRAGKLAVALENHEDSIDRLFNEFDRGLAFSRQVFGSSEGNISESSTSPFEPKLEVNLLSFKTETETSQAKHKWKIAWFKAVERGEDECPICMCSMDPISYAGSATTVLSASVTAKGAPEKSTLNPADKLGGAECAAKSTIVRTHEGAESHNENDAKRKGRRGGCRVREGGTAAAEGDGGIPVAPRKGNKVCRRRSDVKEKRARLLLNCSHIFHKKCLEAFERFNIYEVHLCPVCRQDYESADPSHYLPSFLGTDTSDG